jgi:hypothetical protein
MKIKNIEDLSNISIEVARVIQEHLEKTGESTTAFANKVSVHPLQLLGFLRRERGMHIDTIERIGRKVKESKV